MKPVVTELGGPEATAAVGLAGRGGPGSPARPCWHVLTGEYPPQPGGVGDYSHVLAAALAAAGAEVHVWTSAADGVTPEAAGVAVHRCAGRWSPADLARLGEALDGFAAPRRLLVQYAPNAWGYRGLNLGFCRWLARRAELGDDVRPMIHEPFYPFWLRDKPTRWLLAAGHRWMFRTLLSASSRAYVAIPAWEDHLRAYEPRRRGRAPLAVAWLPVPSNIPVVADGAGAAGLRARLAPGGETVLGSFGTFHGPIRAMLAGALPPLLAGRPDRIGLLIGPNGEGLAAELQGRHPELAGRLVATGRLPADRVSLHLQACDVLLQPYPEGVTTRRGSMMAGLAHGRPTATTSGVGTEPLWEEAGCAALAPAGEPGALVGAAGRLLDDPAARALLGERALATYRLRFDVRRSAEAILEASPRVGPLT